MTFRQRPRPTSTSATIGTRMSGRSKPAWNSFKTDLSAHRATRSELRRRRQLAQSKHNILLNPSSRLKSTALRGKRDGGVARARHRVRSRPSTSPERQRDPQGLDDDGALVDDDDSGRLFTRTSERRLPRPPSRRQRKRKRLSMGGSGSRSGVDGETVVGGAGAARGSVSSSIELERLEGVSAEIERKIAQLENERDQMREFQVVDAADTETSPSSHPSHPSHPSRHRSESQSQSGFETVMSLSPQPPGDDESEPNGILGDLDLDMGSAQKEDIPMVLALSHRVANLERLLSAKTDMLEALERQFSAFRDFVSAEMGQMRGEMESLRKNQRRIAANANASFSGVGSPDRIGVANMSIEGTRTRRERIPRPSLLLDASDGNRSESLIMSGTGAGRRAGQKTSSSSSSSDGSSLLSSPSRSSRSSISLVGSNGGVPLEPLPMQLSGGGTSGVGVGAGGMTVHRSSQEASTTIYARRLK